MPDTMSDTGASFTDDPNGSKAADHVQPSPGGSHDPDPDTADEMEDTLPRRAITAARIAAFRAARESSISRVEAPPEAAEPAPDAASDKAEELVGAVSAVAESTPPPTPDASEQPNTPLDAPADEPLATGEPAQSTSDPARTQPVEETDLPPAAPPATVAPAENALHAADSDVHFSTYAPAAAATAPGITQPPPRLSQTPHPFIENPTAAPPAEMLPKAASAAEPTQILFPPQLPPPPHERQRVVDVSGIHSRVPPDYWLEEDPMEEARVELGLTGSRPIVREAGRPLPKPQRFRGLPRWASVLTLVLVTAFIGVACVILFAIASQALLHPATPLAPSPTHTVAPTGTARR